ncbi:uncharacterized protein B0I36DRAFT_348636 [Microdochium trichocladiopsis]|uniref:BZIP domain-containing protein n=1 Tax=Microdochium trichocladiopsis TaxID=1682393 RepID=A0A9P8YC51_9PEZI|nr:uncharacterized protein B0I36DRAFT_348636 [Microdochium trichocladiopsis]KAH7033599.1 hypothetical protein B0I36DRAFT_348636 [Microdochium trichocladiopsis]
MTPAVPETSSSSIDLKIKRRRERGRRAQSAFRKRQAQAKFDLGTENSRLREALQTILDEVQADDRPELVAKIREAASLLEGLSSSDQTQETESSVEVAQSRSGANSVIDSLQSTYLGSGSEPDSDNDMQRLSRQVQLVAAYSESGLMDRQRMEIINDPLQRVACDSWLGTILPFLGSGAFTLAGRIFWRLTAHWEAMTNMHQVVQLPARLPAVPIQSTQWPSLRDLMYGSVYQDLHEFDVESWKDSVSSRLSYSHGHGILPIHDSKTRNKTPVRWLTPTEVEQRIRYAVGNEVFAVLTQPTLERWEKSGDVFAFKHGPEGSARKEMADGEDLVDALLDWVVANYTCFGDGPRWSLRQFDEGLREWCLRATARATVPSPDK